MKLISIYKGWNLSEAQLVCSRLDSAGFYPVLINEYTATMFGGIFPVFVKVPEIEAAAAKEFLNTPAAPAE
jgi:hypothetical protein